MALFNARSPAWELTKRLSSWSVEKKPLCMLIKFPALMAEVRWVGPDHREQLLPSRPPAPCTKRSGSWSPQSDSARAHLRCCKAAAQRRVPSESPRDQTDSAL